MVETSEIQAIIKYLEKGNSKVVDMVYHNEYSFFQADETRQMGIAEGLIQQDFYFFGHAQVLVNMGPGANTAIKNGIDIQFTGSLKGRVCYGLLHQMYIGNGLYKMGDDTYQGNKRIYAQGCNRVVISHVGFVNVDMLVQIFYNGIVFKMR
jgi:hypothetical protein